MPLYVAALLFFVAVAASLLLLFGWSARTLVEMVLFWLAFTPTLVRHTPRLYLTYSKAKFWIRNTPSTWELSVRYDAVTRVDRLDSFSQDLISWAGEDSGLITRSSSRAVVRLRRRFVLEAHLDEGVPDLAQEQTAPCTLHLAFAPLTVGYRDSRSMLESDLLPLLEHVRDEIEPRSVVYSLRIDLPSRNPFYGLYVEQLGGDKVTDFRVEFRIPAAARGGHITVGKNRLTILADTLDSFRNASAAALALRVPGA